MSLGGYPSMVPFPYYSLERIPQQSIPPELILRFKAQVIVSESESIVTDLGLDTCFPHEQAVVLGRIQPFLIRLDNLEAEFGSMKGVSLPTLQIECDLDAFQTHTSTSTLPDFSWKFYNFTAKQIRTTKQNLRSYSALLLVC
jgi:hypothetical protein